MEAECDLDVFGFMAGEVSSLVPFQRKFEVYNRR